MVRPKKTTMDLNETTHKIAMSLAKRYKRRCWWANIDDLFQEAYRTGLDAQRTWDSEGSVNFQWYAWRAMAYELRKFLWKNSSPLSCSSHNFDKIKGIHRVELKDSIESEINIEKELYQKEISSEVRQRLIELLESNDIEVIQVLLKTKEANQTKDPRATAKAVSRLRNKVKKDYKMYDIWKEL
jgi:DNA-directed RNA polymerase specialized sigma subunit